VEQTIGDETSRNYWVFGGSVGTWYLLIDSESVAKSTMLWNVWKSFRKCFILADGDQNTIPQFCRYKAVVTDFGQFIGQLQCLEQNLALLLW